MMTKFLKHGAGSATKAARYVLANLDHKNKERAGVSCLRGNPELFAAIADSSGFVQRYTSGVIAFAPTDDPSEQDIQDVLDSFEALAFAGLEKKDYHFCAVQHDEDDGSKHIHILIPRVHLGTQKSLNIAPPGWQSTFDVWRDLWNEKKGWASPADPARRRRVSPKFDALYEKDKLKNRETTRELLADMIEEQIKQGLIKNRDDIVSFLKTDLSDVLEVTRTTKKSVSVRVLDAKTNTRLTGVFFDDDFDAEAWLATAKEAGAGDRDTADAARSTEADQERIRQLEKRLAAITEKRAARHAKTYEIKPKHIEKSALRAAERADESDKMDDQNTSFADNFERGFYLDRDNSDHIRDDAEAALGRADTHRDNEQRSKATDFRESKLAQLRTERGEACDLSPFIKPISRNLSEAQKHEYTARNAALDVAERAVRRLFEKLIDATAERFKLDAASRIIAEANANIATSIANIRKGIRRKMRNDNNELETFKSQVNLVQYALSKGYSVDPRRTSQNSTYMRHSATDERIVVATSAQGHGIYFTIGSERDSGTIIDFVQNKQGLNLGQTRKALRPWAGLSQPTAAVKRVRDAVAGDPATYTKPKPVADAQLRLERLKAEYVSLKPYSNNYLLERGLSAETLQHFSKQIKQDGRSNACFFHRNEQGKITGWEKKNKGFTGFSGGGVKGLFIQKADGTAKTETVVICESAIDAMSFYQLDYNPTDEYVAIGGAPSSEQLDMLLSVIKQRYAHVSIALDNDEAGQALTEKLAVLFEQHSIPYDVMKPESKDWNDDLMNNTQKQENRNGIQDKQKD